MTTWFAGLSVFSWRTFQLLLFLDIFPHPSTTWVALFLSKIFIFHCWYNNHTSELKVLFRKQYLEFEEVYYDWLIIWKTLPVVALNLSCENNKVISKIKFSFYCFIYIGFWTSSWVLKYVLSYSVYLNVLTFLSLA